ncbi:MAG: hypothetical protein O9302_01085 [Cyclobacteriaceae bacterium]|jgi:hypothetical protein|nr:hypothetical protein [Flammeovirgaceae bacterium]MCZ8022319.1 hypothetical protein [Cytophagales bacterium]MCZ8326624.1 hypothetical protein [Cyclobacteriaceae bacterium]
MSIIASTISSSDSKTSGAGVRLQAQKKANVNSISPLQNIVNLPGNFTFKYIEILNFGIGKSYAYANIRPKEDESVA